MPLNAEYDFYTGDTGIHLVEITGKRRTVHFLNDTNHLKTL
jgi:2,3-bisphosphoglycerate-dependent phosphoglycerate mutase